MTDGVEEQLEEQLRVQLEEQVAYYRARAPEYDAWADRDGDFDRGERNEGWHAEKRRLAAALHEFRPAGSILEIAGGTGQWTEQLVRYSALLTVLDVAPEALEQNLQRMAQRTRMIEYHEADIFTWEPPERYDVVFFSYWLSHVPPECFEEFWHQVRRCLKPSGRVFFIDNLLSQKAAELDPETPAGDGVSVLREGPDGNLYRVWKVLWRPDDLRRVLSNLGWNVHVFGTGTYFLWGEGTHS